MINMFEGNQQILNLYAEADKPQQFVGITIGIISMLTIFLAVPVGFMGYLAFGDNVESVIIYNLPPNDTLSNIAKCFYVLTIMGSYLIVIQPVFYIIEETKFYRSFLSYDNPVGELVQYCTMRTTLVAFVLGFSYLMPSINLILQISGSISGTIITVIMPVLFYNRAYTDSDKNMMRDLGSPGTDKRSKVKMFNLLVLAVGCWVGAIGFYIAGKEVMSGNVEKDSE